MRISTVALLALSLAACSNAAAPLPTPGNESPAPNFLLLDVNPNSSSHDTGVSPRGFVGQVSGWYFGSAT